MKNIAAHLIVCIVWSGLIVCAGFLLVESNEQSGTSRFALAWAGAFLLAYAARGLARWWERTK